MSNNSNPDPEDFRDVAMSFIRTVTNFVSVWEHTVLPVVQRLAESTSRGELLLADGRCVQLRTIPLPPGLTRADATNLLLACGELGIDPDADGEQYECLIRRGLGEKWLRELTLEGEFARRSLREIGELVLRQTIQMSFVHMNNLLEQFYGEIRAMLGSNSEARTHGELVAPIEKFLGQSRFRALPHQRDAVLVRLVSNDIKHKAGRAVQSAKDLGVQRDTELALNIADFETCSEALKAHAVELASAIVAESYGFDVTDWTCEEWEPTSTNPSYEWLGRFVGTEFLIEWLKSVEGPEGG